MNIIILVDHFFTVKQVLEYLISISSRADNTYEVDPSRLRPIDADLQVPDLTKFLGKVDGSLLSMPIKPCQILWSIGVKGTFLWQLFSEIIMLICRTPFRLSFMEGT